MRATTAVSPCGRADRRMAGARRCIRGIYGFRAKTQTREAVALELLGHAQVLQVVRLAMRHALRAHNGVGSGRVEIEVRQREAAQVVATAEAIAHPVGEPDLHLAILAA